MSGRDRRGQFGHTMRDRRVGMLFSVNPVYRQLFLQHFRAEHQHAFGIANLYLWRYLHIQSG